MTILDLIDRADAAATALVDDTESLTYGELRRQARQVATLLSLEQRGRCIVLRAAPTVRFVTTLLGVMHSGNIPVPIDPALPAAGVDDLVRRCRAATVLDPLPRAALQHACPSEQRNAALPAMVLFTSGTSGRPKGVIVSQANLLHSCQTIAGYLDYRRHPSAAVVLPLHYSYALLSQVCAMLAVGGRVRLFAGLGHPSRVCRAINEEGLETFCGVPSTYYALTMVHSVTPLSMPGVAVACSAGAAMDRSRVPAVREVFPNATFVDNYGMTEATPRIAYIRDDDPRFGQATCGRPIAGVEVQVVNPDTLAPLPDGTPGLLLVRGPNVTAGYLHEPELTRQAFTADGYLISGDVASLRDGYIYLAGRRDEIFTCGGEKVAPSEIEQALTRIDGVEMAAVRGIDDEARGAVPVAFLKLARGLSRRELVDRLTRELARTKVPVRYFEVRGFPLTASGKLQRRQLSPDDTTYVIRELR
jgi:acyl-CoA synthetase (AMP-forming)/AMP-acid ligase II